MPMGKGTYGSKMGRPSKAAKAGRIASKAATAGGMKKMAKKKMAKKRK